jgi:hypothetical protein
MEMLKDLARKYKKQVIEKNFDIPSITALALWEKQIQQGCRSIMVVIMDHPRGGKANL